MRHGVASSAADPSTRMHYNIILSTDGRHGKVYLVLQCFPPRRSELAIAATVDGLEWRPRDTRV